MFNDVGGLIVEDGPQAVGVGSSIGVHGVVEGYVNGGEFIPEVFLILWGKKGLCQVQFEDRRQPK